jgi:Polyketide cyclase / dehydrase and lipid transport
MKSTAILKLMPVEAAEVFRLLHDYGRRLEWDTLLREARITSGHAVAGLGVTALCVGKPLFGRIGIETEYITFEEGRIAAVRMINRPLFFERFAASIRHEAAAEGSRLIYRFQFSAKPGWLRWLLEPVMGWWLERETRQRLEALAAFLEREQAEGGAKD